MSMRKISSLLSVRHKLSSRFSRNQESGTYQVLSVNPSTASRLHTAVGGVERRVLDFGKLLDESNERKFGLGGV